MGYSALEILKKKLKGIGKKSGLTSLWAKYRQWRKKCIQRSYLSVQYYSTQIQGISVRYSTEDFYSKEWFFPRYDKGKIHEPPVTNLLLESLSGAKVFVDVGTNLGWYTCLACKKIPQGEVYGFEMDESNFRLLEKNLELNQCRNARVYHAAVSDVPGTLRYARYGQVPSPSFRPAGVKEVSAGDSTMVTVDSLTLDEFFADKPMPDVIKIDVEGAEIQVLRGMQRILREKHPLLFLEVHPWNLPVFDSSISEVLSLLTGNGYEVYEITDMRTCQGGHPIRRVQAGEALKGNSMLYVLPDAGLASHQGSI